MLIQTAFCCGRKFQRQVAKWRYHKFSHLRQWPGRPKSCPQCNRSLDYSAHSGGHLAACLRYYRRRYERLATAGLTSRGTPRRRRLVPLSRHERLTADRERMRAVRASNHALGLRGDGLPRRRRLWHLQSPKERAWRELRATFAIPSTDPLQLTTAERAEL